MKKYLIMTLIGFLVISICTYGQKIENLKYSIEIIQRNVMTGKSGIYRVIGKKIKRFIKHDERLTLPKLFSTNLSMQDLDSINYYVSDLTENLVASNTYADYAVLDGFDLTVKIKNKSINNVYNIKNCSCIYIDKLIKYLNAQLGKKKLIFPTDFMGANDCCSSKKNTKLIE